MQWIWTHKNTQIQICDGGEAAFWMRKLKQSKTERFEPAVQWASRQKDLQTCKNMQKHAPISLAWTCTLQRDNIWYGTVWSGLYWSNLTCSVWCGQNLKYNMAYVPSRLSMDIQYCTWSKIHHTWSWTLTICKTLKAHIFSLSILGALQVLLPTERGDSILWVMAHKYTSLFLSPQS